MGCRGSAGSNRPWTGGDQTKIVSAVPARSTGRRCQGGSHDSPECAANLVVAGLVAALSPAAVAQEQPYPDLEGTWTGPGQSVTQGKTDHWPDAGAAEPALREGSWTLVVDRQEGNRLTGWQGLTEGTRRDPVLGVIRADGKTIHTVDDGSFLTLLTGPDTLEMCRTEVTAASMLVSCRQLTRQR